jgi:general secretion pathway protein H
MGKREAREKMPTSEVGSKRCQRLSRGFTLLELLIVVTIIAIASAGVVFAMRNDGATQLERDAQRLAALLEQARALARTQGRIVTWRPVEPGFRFEGLLSPALPSTWLHEGTRAIVDRPIVLGPEPLIAAQSIVLTRDEANATRLFIYTDGLQPFQVGPTLPAPAP